MFLYYCVHNRVILSKKKAAFAAFLIKIRYLIWICVRLSLKLGLSIQPRYRTKIQL